MRRISSICMLLTLLLMVGCGKTNANVPSIEEYTWTMFSVQSAEDGQVIAYGERGDSTLDTAKKIELTCVVSDGSLTITDKTNGKSYSGTYRLKDTSSQAVIYDVVIDEKEGIAVVSMTTYNDDSGEPTFIIRLDDYAVNFYAEQSLK